MPRPTARTVHASFAACTVVLVGASVAFRGVPQAIVLEAALLLALGSVVHALRARRPACRRAWRALCLGLLVLVAYSVVWFVWLRGETFSGPVLTLVPVLSFGAFVVAGVSGMLRRDGQALAGLVDAGVVALAIALALWATVVGPSLDAASAPRAVQLASLISVLALGGVTGCLVTLARTADGPGPCVAYLVVAAGATATGFAARVATTSAERADGQWWVAPMWIVGFCAVAAAAWHPAMATLGDRFRAPSPGVTPSILAALGAALGVGPVITISQDLTGRRVDGLTLGVGMLVLVALVVVRVWLLVQAREDAQARLAHLARYDELTGLANRRELDERLAGSVERVASGEAPAVVVTFCDLDGFKEINDVHGHHVGDEVLAVVARRLAGTLRQSDLVARFGGDEFVVVAEGDAEVLARETVQRILEAVAEPVRVGPLLARVGVSTGTAAASVERPLTADQLLSAADAAMYRQKRARRRAAPHAPSPGRGDPVRVAG